MFYNFVKYLLMSRQKLVLVFDVRDPRMRVVETGRIACQTCNKIKIIYYLKYPHLSISTNYND